jgi:hypothetical protein
MVGRGGEESFQHGLRGLTHGAAYPRRERPDTSRRKSEPALASHATSGFLCVQRNSFAVIAFEVAGPTGPPIPARCTRAWSRRAEPPRCVEHAFKTGAASRRIEFFQPAIGRLPGRHSGLIAQQWCSIILLKDLPRRTRGTTKVHGDLSMLADREMTSHILARDPAASDRRPGYLWPEAENPPPCTFVMLRLLRVN